MKAERQQNSKKYSQNVAWTAVISVQRIQFHCWRTLQPNKILSVAMLIPMKVKQDAINNCSSFFPTLIFVEYIQVAHTALLNHCLSVFCLSCFSKSFCNFISNFKGIDIFILNICLLQSFVVLTFWFLFFFFCCFII